MADGRETGVRYDYRYVLSWLKFPAELQQDYVETRANRSDVLKNMIKISADVVYESANWLMNNSVYTFN